ncbi:putative salicylate hydroxylase [Sclerotinia borealis F-4128]|uniref:Putative salicylate hydroxylase n=1 Tax=Sclerotinia borealis (strain F-4128) TaxID=1432307 RepID=W9CJZ3_SCLBF|nr:putative salicylate hydroxylase [Sclerotinia borealis F-4128]
MSEGRKGLYFDFLDGFHKNSSEPSKVLFSLHNDEGSNSVHRAHFLDEMVKFVPNDIAAFCKRVEIVEESDDQGPVTLYFADGIKSHAIAELGEDMAVNSKMHLGPDGHILTFPVDKGKTMNVVAFATTTKEWPDIHKSTCASTKQDALNDFTGWGENVTHILSLLDEDVDIWAIFDMLDHPASTYAKGRKVIIGDAAHATSPHHGSGAGFAIEDSAVLAGLLATPAAKTPRGLRAAFKAFDLCRRPRTQWLVASSRRTGELYEQQTQDIGADVEKIAAEAHERFEKIWQGGIKQMTTEVMDKF